MPLSLPKRVTLVITAILALTTTTFTQTAPVPVITAITQSSAVAGSPVMQLAISGSNFVSGATVKASGETLPTVFVSSTNLIVTMSPARLSTPAIVPVVVTNPDGQASTAFSFLVYSPNPPVISSISPFGGAVVATAGAPGTSLQALIRGTDLIGSSVSITGPGVAVSILPGSQPSNTIFAVAITIEPGALLGQRILAVTTPSGTATQTFTVVDGGAWTLTAPLREPRNEHSATLLLDGRVLVAGGVVNGVYSRTAEIYDSATNSWTATGSMSLARARHASVSLPDGRVLVAGGFDDSAFLSSAELYDPSSGQWMPAGFVNQTTGVQGNLTATLMPNGKVLIPQYSQIYDPSAGTFQTTSGAGLSAAVLPDGRVLVLSSGTYTYDPTTEIWRQITLVVTGNEEGNAILLPDGRIFGRAITSSGKIGVNRSSSAALYDPVTDSRKSSTGNLMGTPVLLSNGAILFAGHFFVGAANVGVSGNQSFIYDPIADLVLPASFMSHARHLPVVTLLPDGRTLVSGQGRRVTGFTPPVTGPAYSFAEVFTPPLTPNPIPAIQSVMTIFGSTSNEASRFEITGSGFLPNSSVKLGNQPLVTIYMGSNKLLSFVPASNRALIGTATLTVTNPGPAGGTAGSTGVITAGAPFVAAITPNSAAAGSTLSATLIGANLSGINSISFSGSGIAAQLEGGGTSTAIPVSLSIATDAGIGVHSVTVTNTSGSYTAQNIFTVQPAAPVLPSSLPLPISEVEQGPTVTGYIVVTPDGGTPLPATAVTLGVVSNASALSQGGILPEALTTDASVYTDILTAGGRNLGLAVANPGNTANTITVTLRDENGSSVSSTTINLGARQQVARFVTELFPPGTFGAAFRGTLRLQSIAPVSVLGLRFAGISFASVPVPHVTSMANAGTVVFPQFAMGGGWATQISLINNASTMATGRVDILDANGNPLPVQMNGQLKSTFTYSLQPGASVLIAPRDINGQSPL
jgi:WD40 repeat protein